MWLPRRVGQGLPPGIGHPGIGGGSSEGNVLWSQPLRSVGKAGVSDRCGWDVDHLSSYKAFDWIPSDGGSPDVGPTLDLTAGSGAPDESADSPWTYNGSAVGAAYFDNDSGRRTATKLSPGSTEDVRIIALFNCSNNRTGNLYRIFSNRDAGPGFTLYWKGNVSRISFYCSSSGGARDSTVNGVEGWCLFDGYWDLDGNIVSYANGVAADTDVSLGGTHGAGDGVSIGCMPDGTDRLTGHIARVMVFFGDSNISNATDYNDIAQSVLGTLDIATGGVPAFTRSGSACKKVGSIWHVFSLNAPRAGSSEGLLIEPARTNKVYNNINPQATTGWSATGAATLTAGNDDETELDTAGLLEFGPDVFEVVNTSGTWQQVRCSATTGNTNAHSVSVFARYVSGSGAEFGTYDVSTGTWSKAGDLSGSYARSEADNITPGDTDVGFALRIPDSCTVRFIMPQLEEGSYCTSPIPNVATAATATRAADDLTTTETLSDTEGSLQADITPQGWSAADLSPNARFFLGTGSYLSYAHTAGWRAYDTTNTTTSGESPTDGTTHTVKTAWNTGNNVLAVTANGDKGTGAYDGSLHGSGVVSIEGTSGEAALIKNLVIKDK